MRGIDMDIYEFYGSLGFVLWGLEVGDSGFDGLETAYFLEIAPPHKGREDVDDEVAGLVVVLAGQSSVGDAGKKREGLEREHHHHLATEGATHVVDDDDHEHGYDQGALHR